jgi:hypothetical protein
MFSQYAKCVRYDRAASNKRVMTNNQRLKVISSVKQLVGLLGEDAESKTLVGIAAAIIELSRLEDLLI